MKLVYISGPYSADTPNGVYENIQRARRAATRFLQAGQAFICPHLNTQFMDGLASYDQFMAVDLEILNRCDAIALMPGWDKSKGARIEAEAAASAGKEAIQVPEEWVK
jgi:hypothetical protein